ncbi:MAG TPA: glycosyltransferase [Nitrospirales bacterium]|nr:glycosyltransferase [Nitrospirales bacterium]
MRLLFITNNVPYPPTDGWKIRVWAILRRLAARHAVTVVTFMRTTEDPSAADQLRANGIKVEAVRRDPRYSAIKLMRGLVGRTAFSVLNYDDTRMHAMVRRVLADGQFDVVQAESVQMSPYCVGASAFRVLDLHNIESLLMRRYAQCAANPLKRAYAEITWRKLAAYESSIYGRFDHCLACSEEDRRIALRQAPEAKITVVPNGVDVRPVLPGRAPLPGPPRLVFVGRMDYHANVDGMLWFCREILPRIRSRRGDVRVQIVGGHPSPEIRALEAKEGIEVTGFVSEVNPYVSDAAVMIVPLRVGGGTRLKVLEAMAMGKAIVSTTVGAEGIAVTPGADIVFADDPASFATAVLQLLDKPAHAERLGAAARRLAEARYDWDGIVDRLEALYLAGAARRSGGTVAAPLAAVAQVGG